ncbi:MAG: outer membrane protein assembly factor BamB [Betaproteobacteria bacterium]|nr:outer membrane protein assembly factor BamB [Betaproteobacteria bacterium]
MDARRWILAGVALGLLGGCASVDKMGGWVGGWFSGAPKAKPAELSDIKQTASLSRAWEANAGAGAPYGFSPASDGQAIYAAGKEGRLLKIDITSGRELARAEIGKPISAGVGVGDGLVLVGTAKGEVLAFHGKDLQPAWSAKLAGEILVAPTAAHGVVAVRSNNGSISLLESASGKPRWSQGFSLPALTLREAGSLALTRQALYAGQPGGKLMALSLANGAPVWEANVGQPRGATELERIADITGALAVDERMVCAAAYQGRVACFDARDGRPLWSRELSGFNGVEMDSRQVYAADEHAGVYAYDKERGINLWKQTALRDRQLSTPLAQGAWVLVGDYQGYIHALSRDDGSFVARVGTDGSRIRGPMLALDRGFVVQTANGGVYAFKIQ